ncbi:MAG: amino acid decarboxylase [Bacteroidetes bacterium CG12_big_fil_rev_8_21_14_0_65_60_17]|nr:MAG: amino acid decarboxylase [Bacteroidetes bacterium CG12_big_fil_rev_8_21_14_0_65_60_17]
MKTRHDTDLLEQELERLEPLARKLETPAADRNRRLEAVHAYASDYLDAQGAAPAYTRSPDLSAGLLDTPISETGAGLDAALDVLDRYVDHEGLNTTSGRFTGYVPGGGVYESALGDYLAAVTNRYAGVFFASPGAVRMENQLVRWMAGLVGFPAEAGGYLSAGGSLANLTAVVTARDVHGIEAGAVPRAVVYLSDHAHHCVDKALRVAGLGRAVLRRVPVDEAWRMDAGALASAIEDDLDDGLMPWLVVASAGTTNTGSVDPLADIADVADRHGLWFHVDAAYGGFFLLTETGKNRLRGIERAHSVVMDPHKTLFLPYGSGALIVRDGALIRQSHLSDASYMQDARAADGEWSPAHMSPELTKHFRGLRMWLPLQVHGVAPFRDALDEKLVLARWAWERLRASDRFEVGPKPDLTVVTFRLRGSDEANRRLLEAVHQDGRVFFSSTVIDGRFTLRLAIVSFRSHLDDIRLTLDVLEELAASHD